MMELETLLGNILNCAKDFLNDNKNYLKDSVDVNSLKIWLLKYR